MRVLIFEIGDLLCGIPADLAREVLPTNSTTRIPGADPVVEGLANVRGTVVTVVNGSRLLKRAPLPDQDGDTIVIELADRPFGLRVGRVRDLVDVQAGQIEAGKDLAGVDPALVHAVGRVGNEHFVLLDLPALLTPVIAR